VSSAESALVAGLAAAVLVAVPGPAAAYVCTRTDAEGGIGSGASLSWFKRDIPYTFYADGTTRIAGDAEFDVLRASFAVWPVAEGCDESGAPNGRRTDVSFHETNELSYIDRVGYDYAHPAANENLLIFHDRGWPLPGQGDIIALTTTTYDPLTGEILDADIEFNTADWPFAIDGDASSMDLMNAAVHEIGHVLGLAHSPVKGSTMEAQGQLGETKKRTLECDDENAVVFKYPAGGENGYCEPTAACGYCAAPGELKSYPFVRVTATSSTGGGCAGGVPGAAGVLAVLALAVRRRRWWRHTGEDRRAVGWWFGRR
jgi:hypothetical protein